MRFSLYSFVLPLLVGLAAFSSKERSPDYELTQFLSWALLIVLGLIFVRHVRAHEFALLLFFTAVGVKALLVTWPDVPGLNEVALFMYAVMAVFAGGCLALKQPMLLLKQMFWLSLISIGMSLLQIGGVLWAQKIGSALDWKVASDTHFLFRGYSAELWGGLSQTRPDGFTHANNLTSQLLLFFYAHAYFFSSVRTNLPRPPLRWLFAIAFAGALTGGKVSVLGIVVINAVGWLFLRKRGTRPGMRAAGVTVAAYLAYFALFPGLFILNFNLDLFLLNAMGRVLNLAGSAHFSMLLPFYEYLASLYLKRSPNLENPDEYLRSTALLADEYSGIAHLAPYLLVIVPSVIVLGILWVRNLRLLDRLYVRNIRYFALIMLVALTCSIFGGPFVRTIWFSFFASFALIPLTLPHLLVQVGRPKARPAARRMVPLEGIASGNAQ